MEGGNSSKKPASAETLEEAFASLEEIHPLPSKPSVFDAPTILPPPPEKGEEQQPATTDLSFTERITLEESLLKNARQELQEIAADSLVEIAESSDCTIIPIRRILDILTHYNKENEGMLSGQLRKVKRRFDFVLGNPLEDAQEDLEFARRDTLPFPGKEVLSGAPKQGPQPPVVDTTEKIQRGKAKQ